MKKQTDRVDGFEVIEDNEKMVVVLDKLLISDSNSIDKIIEKLRARFGKSEAKKAEFRVRSID